VTTVLRPHRTPERGRERKGRRERENREGGCHTCVAQKMDRRQSQWGCKNETRLDDTNETLLNVMKRTKGAGPGDM